MEDSRTIRNLIGFTGLALLAAGYLLQNAWSGAMLFIAAGQLGLVSAFGLEYVARHRKPDLRQRAALKILRREWRF